MDLRVTLLAFMTAACAPSPGSGGNPSDDGPVVQTDTLEQQYVATADILFVVGPTTTAEELISALPFGVGYAFGTSVDYRIGVTSTAMGDEPGTGGRLATSEGLHFVDNDTADPMDRLTEMVQSVSEVEESRGLDAIFAAVDDEPTDDELVREDFFREDSLLSVFVLSEEDDASEGINQDEFVDWFTTLRLDATLTRLDAMVSDVGFDYARVAEQTGGALLDDLNNDGPWPPSDRDWRLGLDTFGRDSVGIDIEFGLTQLPTQGTLELKVEQPILGEEPNFTVLTFSADDFVYDEAANAVRFNSFIPEPGSRVVMTYEVAE